jgi:hypothetical protein
MREETAEKSPGSNARLSLLFLEDSEEDVAVDLPIQSSQALYAPRKALFVELARKFLAREATPKSFA